MAVQRFVNTRHHPARARRQDLPLRPSGFTSSPMFVFSSLMRALNPIIPVHPRNAPVSPIIPVYMQKQGGGGCTCTFELLTLNFLSPLTPIIPALTSHFPVSPIIPALTQKQGGGGGMLTMSLSEIVGAPTFLSPSPRLAPVCKDSPIPLSFPVECQPKVSLICPLQRIAGEANASCST